MDKNNSKGLTNINGHLKINTMRDLVNIIGEYKHKVGSETLDEIMITYLYNFVVARPNDTTLGKDLRKDVLQLYEIFLEVKAKRDKTPILD